MSKTRGYCFTINNYSAEDLLQVQSLDCEYCIVGAEVAPETGTPHYQGYAYFSSPRTLSSVSKKLKRAHLIPAKGTAAQNRKYCVKEGNVVFEKGDPPKQGERNDLEVVRDIVTTGSGKMADVVLQATSYQSVRMAECILKYHERKRDWKPQVTWIWGATGTGKSYSAHKLTSNAYTTGSNGKWFDGYDAHEDVIIDDFRSTWMPYANLLRLLDRYPYTVECKGGTRQFLAKNIIITSCYPPNKVYGNSLDEDVQQLLRRIDCVKELKDKYLGDSTNAPPPPPPPSPSPLQEEAPSDQANQEADPETYDSPTFTHALG